MQEEIVEYDTSTMGEILRNARLKQGKTLRDAADELCIRRFYLEAIEGMDFENIPPAPYGTGFIRSYAQYLGLNSERIMLSYRKSIGEIDNDVTPENTEPPAAPKIRHIVLGIIGLAAVVATWAWFVTQEETQPVETENFESDVVVPEPEIIDTPEEQNSAPEAVTETREDNSDADAKTVSETDKKIEDAPNENVVERTKETTESKKDTTLATSDKPVARMQMKLVGPTWVELKQDGKVLISNVYKKGFTYDIPTEGDITVSVGRYYNAEFWLDGQKVKVVTAMRKKNVPLNKFMNQQKKN